MKKLLLLLSAFVLLFMISLVVTSCDSFKSKEYRSGWVDGFIDGDKQINSNWEKQTYYEFDNIPIPSHIKDTIIFYHKVDSLNKLEYNLCINYSDGKMSIQMKKWYISTLKQTK